MNRDPSTLLSQIGGWQLRNHGESSFRSIHMRLFIKTTAITRFRLFPSARLYWPPVMCPIVGLAKVILVLNGVKNSWPLVKKNYIFTSFFISNNLIAFIHGKILGDKIPDITWLLNNLCEKRDIWFHHPGNLLFTMWKCEVPKTLKLSFSSSTWFTYIQFRKASLVYRTKFPWIFEFVFYLSCP